MRPSKTTAFLLSLIMCAALHVDGEVLTKASLGSGYQANLFSDSTATGDAYASAGLELKYYPSASAELAVGAQYNAFTNYSDLSNVNGALALTVVPTPAASPLSLAVAGHLSVRKFGRQYELYDRLGASAGMDACYRLLPWAFLQSSAYYSSVSYPQSDYAANRGLDAAVGFNLALPWSNALVFRVDFSRRVYDQPKVIATGMGNTMSSEEIARKTYDVTGARLRLSRPLGDRTGLSLSIGHRHLHMDRNFAAFGYTIDYLSPWADLWQGTSVSGRLKHFFPAQVIGDLSVAYYEKSFADVIEFDDGNNGSFRTVSRDDKLVAASLSLSRPFSLAGGRLLTPALQLGYRNNRSTIETYHYDDLQASLLLEVAL